MNVAGPGEVQASESRPQEWVWPRAGHRRRVGTPRQGPPGKVTEVRSEAQEAPPNTRETTPKAAWASRRTGAGPALVARPARSGLPAAVSEHLLPAALSRPPAREVWWLPHVSHEDTVSRFVRSWWRRAGDACPQAWTGPAAPEDPGCTAGSERRRAELPLCLEPPPAPASPPRLHRRSSGRRCSREHRSPGP